MRNRIFRSMLLLAVVTILIGSLLSGAVTHAALTERVHAEVRSEAKILSLLLPEGGTQTLFEQASQANPATRLTLIDTDGTVLFDSMADPATMENHADRLEVRLAMQVGTGEESRNSGTRGEKTYYYALRLENGQILRMAAASDGIWEIFLRQAGWLLAAMIPVLLFAAWLANRQTRAIVAPLLTLDLDRPMNNDVYDELSPLLVRMERQRTEIARQIDALDKQQQEFAAITGQMQEGLAVLDAKLQVLSLNRSAAALFGVDADTVRGRSFLTLSRDGSLSQVLSRAVSAGESGSAELSLGGRCYQLIATPVRPGAGGIGGVVLLSLDITEQKQAEQLRREFTANVSHELKTPLTSISGYAEMIESGIVRQEDLVPFAARIHSEASRMIQLVEDLLALSRLDEQAVLPDSRPVGLLAVSKRVADRLSELARTQKVTISVEGTDQTVQGDPALLEELVANLCENAIKYNRPGGSVTVSLSCEDRRPCLRVSDTGVGIAKEHQSRVFERFYRVDKSRSKETGGTGLGLSIVKHIAQLHRATLSLTSEDGQGTTVQVLFPAQE
ncbi:MAG: hypothetical protein DBX44_01610 [Oscillospiraceae bacterium]|nr:MAG: hypothetical protein DBX44_01610 [Oscillospiraceae bacterium]